MAGWNRTYVDGPISIPVFGPEEIDPETGAPWRPVIGEVEGYHLNVAREIVTPVMAVFEVTPDPATPFRTFSGDACDDDGRFVLTAFLRFADEAEAIEAMGAWAG